MIVLDASAALAGLLGVGQARQLLVAERVQVPHLADPEIANALRRQVVAGRLDADEGHRRLERWRQIGVTRHAVTHLLERIWELRENVTAYDASYVALAEALACPLVTADRRLARATGPRCVVTLLPE